MLRSLLEDSFRLTVHRESREVQGYALVVAKSGFKLKPVEGGGNDTQTSGGRVRTLTAKSTSMAWLADLVARYMDAPVVDKSGLEGVFDFDLRWTNGDLGADRPDPGDEVPSFARSTAGDIRAAIAGAESAGRDGGGGSLGARARRTLTGLPAVTAVWN